VEDASLHTKPTSGRLYLVKAHSDWNSCLAFSVPALAFEGDLPASIFHLQLIENDIADWNAKAEVIAVFHTNAGHVTLNDEAYNTERKVATGNPYKQLVADLMSCPLGK